jgi:tRNA dimethylallyltransferase
LELARRLGAEIVSLDSMAIYRGMDIGTAKPSRQQRAEIPHHLVDLVDPWEEFSVARYVDAAHETIAEIRSRGRDVIFVGGTPLYLKSLLRGLFEGPEADWDFRREVEQELATAGQEALHERLVQVDPVTAARLHPNDTRRLIRALEVYRLTGQPISHMQMEFDEQRRPIEAYRAFALKHPRERLHARIDHRVESMFEQGLVDEVRGLTTGGRTLGRTASQAVGYREAIEHLSGGPTLERTIEQVKIRTRRFARRQETWFRSLGECRSIPIEPDESPASIAQRILAQRNDAPQ